MSLAAVLTLGGCQTPPPPPPVEHAVVQKGLTETQVTLLKQEGFKQTDEGWERSLSDKVLFGSDEAALDAKAQQLVQDIGHALIGVGIDRVRVDGHTDGTGSDAYNDGLSLRRANSVAALLAGVGIPRENIATRGLGKRVPVADNRTEAGRTENRRVAIVIASE